MAGCFVQPVEYKEIIADNTPSVPSSTSASRTPRLKIQRPVKKDRATDSGAPWVPAMRGIEPGARSKATPIVPPTTTTEEWLDGVEIDDKDEDLT